MDSSDIDNKLENLALRLSRIESYLRIPVFVTEAKSKAPSALSVSSTPNVSATATAEIPVPARDMTSGNWLGIIAVICFVVAGGFIIKLSIETGWLTTVRQMGVATLLGLTLIGCGLALRRSDREFASFLPGAGIIILYLTGFATFRLYHLISFEAALGLTGLISALSIWIYGQIRHDAYAVIAAIGAYLAPVVLGLSVTGSFAIYYYLICSTTFAVISVWVQARGLILVAAQLAIVMTALTGFELNQDLLTASTLALHFIIFSSATYLYSLQSKTPLQVREAWCYMPVLLIFYTIEYYFIHRLSPELAPWMSLTFAGSLMGLYLLAKKQISDNLGSQSLIFAFVAVVLFHAVYIELLPEDLRCWLLPITMLAASYASGMINTLRNQAALIVPGLAIGAIVVTEYLAISSHLTYQDNTYWLAVSGATLVSMWMFLVNPGNRANTTGVFNEIFLGATHILAVLSLYRLTTHVGSLAVSASWLFYAVAVIVFAATRKDHIMAKSALFILGFAAGKALLYDAASAATTIRIFCLLLTGAVLYGCGYFMRKIRDWAR